MADGHESLPATVESSADAWPVGVLLASDDDEVAFGDDDVSPFELGLDGLRDPSGRVVAGKRSPTGRRGSVLPIAAGAAAIAAFVAVFSGAGEKPSRGEGGRVQSSESAALQPTQRISGGRPDGAFVAGPAAGSAALASDEAAPTTKAKKRKSSPAKDGPSAPAPGDGGSGPPATSPGPTVAVPGVVEATVNLPGGSKATITLPGLPPVSVTTPPVALPPALPQLPLGGPK